MFDDRLFDVIMEEMMGTFGVNVRTDEASLAYNACCKIAQKLEEIYGDMSDINDNLLVDTMDISHLISYAKERGLDYQYATAPIVKGVFYQSIEIGERFLCNDYVYTVIELIDGYSYKMECDTEGTEANANIGVLNPIDYIDDWQGGEITEVIIAGLPDQDEEEFRQLVKNSFRQFVFGGNKTYYREFINALDGVGGCKPKRREEDSPWVNVWIISNTFGVPSEQLVNDVQTATDPEVNHGEGDGIAPICHSVQIYPVEEITVDISTTITFDTGYSTDTSLEVIKGVIEEYLNELCKSWESLEVSGIIVRLAQIEARIISIEGVLDVTSTTLNGKAENIILDFKQIPLLGGVEIV